MNNTLVTILDGAIEDTSRLRVGEMRMHFSKVASPTKATQGFKIQCTKETKLEIIGDGHFTDETLAQDLGKSYVVPANTYTTVYVSNEDNDIAILDKYSITQFDFNSGSNDNQNKSLDFESFKYSYKMTYLSTIGAPTVGDISSLKDLTNLTNIYIDDSKCTGDVATLKNLTNLSLFSFKGVKGLSGNLGVLPDSLKFITNAKTSASYSGFSAFSWTSTTRKNILAMEGIKCSNLDQLFTDMATMEAKPLSDSSWHKLISVIGVRTSASDSAVATLQSKGYTVQVW